MSNLILMGWLDYTTHVLKGKEGLLMIPWEEPIPECAECVYHEQPYDICRCCRFAFSENKTNYFKQKED